MISIFLPALVITLGLQELRVFFPSLAWYLKDTVGLSSLQLAPIAFGTVATVFLTPLIARRLGWPKLFSGAAVGLAIVRVAEQVVIIPAADFVLSTTAVILFFTALAAWVSGVSNRNLALSLTLGCTIDTAIRGLVGTLDLSWHHEWWALAAVITLASVIIGTCLSNVFGWWVLPPGIVRPSPQVCGAPSDESRRHPPLIIFAEISSMIAIGPFLFLQLLIFQNFGWIAETLHLSFRAAFGVIMGANMLLVAGTAAAFRRSRWVGEPSAVVLTKADGGGVSPPEVTTPEGRRRCPVMFGTGMLLFIAMVFAYYASYDIRIPIPRSIPGAVAATPFVADPTIRVPPLAPRDAIKVMTYNIHSAYTIEGRQDPEAIAHVIETSGADIIGLQEVSRGWVIDGATDLVTWLSRRLNMHAIFKGTADPVLGNAIFSRYPIREWGAEPLPSDDILLSRGLLWAHIDVGLSQPLLVIDTHLHHVRAEHAPRVKQMHTLLDFWAKRPHTIIMGDMNAEPGEPAIALILQTELMDAWGATGHEEATTFRAESPTHRIDWIFHTPDLHAMNVDILDSTASDHFPVVATIQSVNE